MQEGESEDEDLKRALQLSLEEGHKEEGEAVEGRGSFSGTPFARVEGLIEQLLDLGVERPVAEHALWQTGYLSLDAALNW